MEDPKLLAKLNTDKLYKLTKVHDDGSLESKGSGYLYNPDGELYKDQRVIVGRWSTSPLQEVEFINKGIKFLTLNSVYILEEVPDV